MLFPFPLACLAAFALAFAAGVITSWAFTAYGRWMHRKGQRSDRPTGWDTAAA